MYKPPRLSHFKAALQPTSSSVLFTLRCLVSPLRCSSLSIEIEPCWESKGLVLVGQALLSRNNSRGMCARVRLYNKQEEFFI